MEMMYLYGISDTSSWVRPLTIEYDSRNLLAYQGDPEAAPWPWSERDFGIILRSLTSSLGGAFSGESATLAHKEEMLW